MKKSSIAFFAVLAVLFAHSTPIFAHHGYAAYDMQLIKSAKATITGFSIMNPHSNMTGDVKDANGNIQHWVWEGGPAPHLMKAYGWDRESLKPGDEVTIYYHPVKGEGHAGLFLKVVFADGRVLSMGGTGEQGSGQ
jgi:hypothetical protein